MGKKDETKDDAVEFGATFLYHPDKAPEGELFEDQDAHDAALKDGYVDTPAKFGKADDKKKK
jgi:hypothetical protein